MPMCGVDHSFVMSVVDEIEGHDGRTGDVVECMECGRCYVAEDDGTFVPISNMALVDAGAWDGHQDGQGLFALPYWERLNG